MKYWLSVIIPVYNSEKYLRKLITSLRVKENKDIKFIFVDNNSTDKSVQIINKYLSSNLVLEKEEKQGQNHARIRGIEFSESEWITFVDSDDYLSRKYFENVKKALLKSSVDYAITRIMNFDDRFGAFKMKHPLDGKFNSIKGYKEVNPIETKSYSMSLCNSFFKKELLNKILEKYNEFNFAEDAIVALSYISELQFKNILLISNSIYYYRLHSNSSSKSNSISKYRYIKHLSNFSIPLLEKYDNPIIKDAILYDLHWTVNNLEKHPNKLWSYEWEERNLLIRRILSFYKKEEIVNSKHRFKDTFLIDHSLINNHFKDNKCFIKFRKDEFTEVHVITRSNNIEVIVDGKLIDIDDIEHKKQYIKGKKKILKLNIPNFNNIDIFIDKAKQEISNMEMLKRKPKQIEKNSIIMLFDRPNKADDNAEAMYKTLSRKGYKNIHFVIKKSSPDWKRLKNEGFNLLKYKSYEFKKKYMVVDCIYSSSLNLNEIYDWKKIRSRKNIDSRFVFLQHGVTLNPLYKFFNKKNIDEIHTSFSAEEELFSISEFDLFSDSFNRNGLERWKYLNTSKTIDKTLVYLPSWSKKVLDRILPFKITNFYKRIKNDIQGEYISQYREQGYKISIMIHPMARRHWNKFSNLNVKCLDPKNNSYKEVIEQYEIGVTNFSSVIIDFAKIGKTMKHNMNCEKPTTCFFANDDWKKLF